MRGFQVTYVLDNAVGDKVRWLNKKVNGRAMRTASSIEQAKAWARRSSPPSRTL